jgi:hypothetical protein
VVAPLAGDIGFLARKSGFSIAPTVVMSVTVSISSAQSAAAATYAAGGGVRAAIPIAALKRLVMPIVCGLLLVGCSSRAGSTSHEPGPATTRHMMAMEAHRPPSLPSTNAAKHDTQQYRQRSELSGASGPPAAVVPDVEGMMFAAAVHRLWRAGINVHLVLARESLARRWIVLEQDPAAGMTTPSSGRVNLVLSLHRVGGVEVSRIVECRPVAGDLRDPRCLGKVFRY